MRTQRKLSSNSDDQIQKFTSNQSPSSNIDHKHITIQDQWRFLNQFQNLKINTIICILFILLIVFIAFNAFLSFHSHQCIKNQQKKNIEIQDKQINNSQKTLGVSQNQIQKKQINIMKYNEIQGNILNMTNKKQAIRLKAQKIKQNTPTQSVQINEKQHNLPSGEINQYKNQSVVVKKIKLNQLPDKDQADFVIKNRQKIQSQFNQKFEDLIYTVPGTNITRYQFEKAKERMNIWKYINPKTKKIQFLDEVNYQITDLTLDSLSTLNSSSILNKTSNKNTNSRGIESQLSMVQKIIKQEKLQYQNKYNVSKYMQIPFCVVIPSFKNVNRVFRNLNSILVQEYQAFHIIYIDDASGDGTADQVRQYIKKYQIPQTKLLFIENNVTQRALPNINYAAKNQCKSGQIMTIIDGDDYLIGTQVFKVVNSRYQSQNLLFLYSNNIRDHLPYYLKVSYSRDYPQKIKKNHSFRKYNFIISHLRTFYVDLYWKIQQKDLKDSNNNFFTASNDIAILTPIVQMAASRFQYLPQLQYMYDASTGYNNFFTKKKIQQKNYYTVRKRKIYKELKGEQQFQIKLKKQIKQFQKKSQLGKQVELSQKSRKKVKKTQKN